jgi:hypothetical protein
MFANVTALLTKLQYLVDQPAQVWLAAETKLTAGAQKVIEGSAKTHHKVVFGKPMPTRAFSGQKRASIWDAINGGLAAAAKLPLPVQLAKGPFPHPKVQAASRRPWESGRWIHTSFTPGTGRLEVQRAGFWGFADARNDNGVLPA